VSCNEPVTAALYQALRFLATWLQQDTMVYVAHGLQADLTEVAPGRSEVAQDEPADSSPQNKPVL
jgi:hypothetical protein